MSNVLCTFSGKYGDILWSLPTARAISRMHSQKVDFFMMPYYGTLCELIGRQSYIENCGVWSDWLREHSNHGDQPWQPQNKTWEAPYDYVYHLTYKGHPGINAPSMALVDFIAWQHGIKLQTEIGGIPSPVVPFIDVDDSFTGVPGTDKPAVVLSFNDQYKEMKDIFKQKFFELIGDVYIIDMANCTWDIAAHDAKHAIAYVGDRSANWVIANGVGQKTIITYEPHQARHTSGGLGKVFGNPYWSHEFAIPLNVPPEVAGDIAASMVKKAIGG